MKNKFTFIYYIFTDIKIHALIMKQQQYDYGELSVTDIIVSQWPSLDTVNESL